MSDDPSLFEIFEESPSSVRKDLPIRREQIEQIRAAFVKAGIVGQQERKALINALVIRDIAALHELHAVEAGRIIAAINQRSEAKPRTAGSSWDMREEDTWIDKL